MTVTDQAPATPSRATPRRMAKGEPERWRERLTYWGYLAAERLINALPRRIVLPTASAVGNVAYDATGSKAELIRQNLARPMRRSPGDRRVARVARGAFQNYAKYLADVMRIGELSDAQAAALVAIDNVEILDAAQAEGKGVLVCTVHVGGMDLIGAGLKRAGHSLHVVADDTTYGRLYDHLAAARARQHIFLIGWRNLRGIMRALREGENLVLFCDGGYRPGDVPVELFGAATTFPPGPATLSARTGAPMLPVACRREADETFTARGLPLIHARSTEPGEIHRATQELADALASVIAADPAQWYMFRPVWPQGEAERADAQTALDAARRGEDWTRITPVGVNAA